MSYSVESKKRKFHRALESLSSNGSQKRSLNPHPRDPHMSTPKAIDPTIKRVRLTPGSEVDDTITPVSTSPLANHSPAPSLRPNFVPWDRDRFLERLETFRKVDRWSPKPDAVNEVQWAKRGWSCVGVMRVECVGGCGLSLVVKLPDDMDDLEDYDSEKVEERRQVQAALVDKYAGLIVDGHGEKCPWRKTGCDETIHRLLMAKPDKALSGLRERYLNLASLGEKIPPLECIAVPEGVDICATSEMISSKMLSSTQSESECVTVAENPTTMQNGTKNGTNEAAQDSVNLSALALALFGWDLSGNKSAGVASCKACFRRLGLWMYMPKDDGSSSIYPNLDVVGEHLDYCPWINAKTQSGSGKARDKDAFQGAELSGWQILRRVIINMHRRQNLSIASETQAPECQDGTTSPNEMDPEAKKAKDREWWSKLRRVRQAFKGQRKSRG
ncbi:hypothetical protein LOZ57_005677 [Ophidiomyces ophidiicola]|uniref:uncharacterized protein n=1 Tax=Ophidiomyces ophidiicola TaxID=1387563 RepID=UPI0020C4A1E3|nr:uncharacterized protein LOZ57_005677 [Ophidiomyces ophidiicola]KAI1941548.1 hypothetical protein LOZ57_005677 [Ophidiomyces ophidiicola]KAI2051313.1 hypothetical protein LOZ43_004778 [Ophidiomyces ophidiicola]KAI2084749.1 hypothetical protein LOZ36_004569 [Ophidiomyces ophidiicola]